MKIGVIFNPYARKNYKNPSIFEKMKYIVGDKGIVEMSQHLDEIPPIGKHFIEEGVEFIAISGGDGTMMNTISRLKEVYRELPPLLILRGGTMNMLGDSVGIKENQLDTLRKFVSSDPEKIKFVERDTIKVGKYYAFIFGIGVVPNFLSAYYEGPRTGAVKATEIIVRGVVSGITGGQFAKKLLQKVYATVTINGREVPFEVITAILAQTIENLSLGFKPMYRALEKKGTFHTYVAGLSLPQIITKIPHLFLGKPIKHKLVYDELAETMIIDSKFPLKYTLDGDLFESEDKIIAKIGPSVKFAIPERKE